MKKIFSLLMVAVALCGFTLGCAGGDSAPAPSTPETSTESDAGATDAAPAEGDAAPAEGDAAPAAPAES